MINFGLEFFNLLHCPWIMILIRGGFSRFWSYSPPPIHLSRHFSNFLKNSDKNIEEMIGNKSEISSETWRETSQTGT